MTTVRTESLLARALDPAVSPPDDATSERILDAALELAGAIGLRHVTIDDVARRASVGRITVYRRFTDRRGLVDALTVRETRRCLRELRSVVDVRLPVADQIADGFVAALRIAREHPLLSRFARLEPEVALATLKENGGQIFGLLRTFLTIQIRAAGASTRDLSPAESEAAAEMLVRLGMSFFLVPESAMPLDDDDALRHLAKRLLVPMIVR